MPNHRKTSYEDFWNHVQKTDTCWLWTGSVNGKYGRYSVAHKHRARAHVFVLTHFMGVSIPEGGVVCHKCDNPLCVNPDHLYVGTKSSNFTDWLERQATPEQKQGMVDRLKWPEVGSEEYEQRCKSHSAAARSRSPREGRF